ncbi:MAG: cobalamin biosynthesis protein CbiM [Acidobacteria bacterium]|jgi:cobalt/nickel transport system permease protein|nr:MAG: cobalamin biosynthesis protein CbiM [Acidobacteriota bacterium]
MHIPDGFIAPQVYLPAYVINLGLFFYALKVFRRWLRERTISYLASLSAFAFVLTSIALPLPGGTSVHGLGVGPMAILFGPWVAFACLSVVFFLQAFFFGLGGVSSFPINALSIAFLGSFSAYGVYRLFGRGRVALFLSGFLSTLLSALFIALILGLHSYLFREHGRPVYFPLGFEVVIPALLLPHLFVGVGEGLLNLLMVGFLRRRLSLEG